MNARDHHSCLRVFIPADANVLLVLAVTLAVGLLLTAATLRIVRIDRLPILSRIAMLQATGLTEDLELAVCWPVVVRRWRGQT